MLIYDMLNDQKTETFNIWNYAEMRIWKQPVLSNLCFPGALGVMYEYGIGVRRNTDSAYVCLKGASDRGNVYAMGNLVAHYYGRKLYTKAADLASRYVTSSCMF